MVGSGLLEYAETGVLRHAGFCINTTYFYETQRKGTSPFALFFLLPTCLFFRELL